VLDDEPSAAAVFNLDDITTLFYIPLSQSAYQELQELQYIMQSNVPSEQQDVWSYAWGHKYTSAKFYDMTLAHIKVDSMYVWIWKSACMMKLKMFAWLLLSDRLNTRDLLQRRNWRAMDDKHCELFLGRNNEDKVHLNAVTV
jgi:hypothetical protein